MKKPSGGHLRLDEVFTKFPELGPTAPDGGYAWIVLCGVFLVQMTIPSIPAMYGVVSAYGNEAAGFGIDVWNERILLTCILFAAFWNLADPWTRMIVGMAPMPRLVGLVGVFLLTVGMLAQGYLADGVDGIYLASISAGAVMGIGASFVTVLSDSVLRKYFSNKLLIALTIRNVGTSLGLALIPSITNILLHVDSFIGGLQYVIPTVLLPSLLGTFTFRQPSEQRSSLYSLLLSTEKDAELPIKISSDAPKDSQHPNSQDEAENYDYGQTEATKQAGGLLGDGNDMYSYQDMDEDVDLFVNPTTQSDKKWVQLWAVPIGWLGMKMSTLLFWALLPVFAFKLVNNAHVCMTPSIVAGFSTILPNLLSNKTMKLSSQNRRFYFGVASLLCAMSLIGLSRAPNYTWLMVFAFLGGISIGVLLSCQDLALCDFLGSETVRSTHKGLSVIVSLCMLGFCYLHDVNGCVRFAALLQLIGGLYWILPPLFGQQNRKNRQQSRTETRHDLI